MKSLVSQSRDLAKWAVMFYFVPAQSTYSIYKPHHLQSIFFLPDADHNNFSGVVEIAVVFASLWTVLMASWCRAAYVPGVLRSSSPPGVSIKSIGCNTSLPNIRKFCVNPVWRLTVDLIAIPTVARCISQSSCCTWIKQRSICKMVRFIRSTWPFALSRYGVVLVLTIFSRSHTSLNIRLS